MCSSHFVSPSATVGPAASWAASASAAVRRASPGSTASWIRPHSAASVPDSPGRAAAAPARVTSPTRRGSEPGAAAVGGEAPLGERLPEAGVVGGDAEVGGDGEMEADAGGPAAHRARPPGPGSSRPATSAGAPAPAGAAGCCRPGDGSLRRRCGGEMSNPAQKSSPAPASMTARTASSGSAASSSVISARRRSRRRARCARSGRSKVEVQHGAVASHRRARAVAHVGVLREAGADRVERLLQVRGAVRAGRGAAPGRARGWAAGWWRARASSPRPAGSRPSARRRPPGARRARYFRTTRPRSHWVSPT